MERIKNIYIESKREKEKSIKENKRENGKE